MNRAEPHSGEHCKYGFRDHRHVDQDALPPRNALFPQELHVAFASGETQTIAIPDTLGSPAAPLSRPQQQAKLDLARALSGDIADERLFDDPLAYFVEPQ